MKSAALLSVVLLGVGCAGQAESPPQSAASAPATRPAVMMTSPAQTPGEKVPSEDSQVKDFHSLGLVDGRVDIYRCSSPVREIHSPDQARAVFQHLHDLGIVTVVSLEDPNRPDEQKGSTIDETKRQQARERFILEQQAAAATGITFVNHPMNNAGPNSFQTMTDEQVWDWLDAVSADVLERAKSGGIVFHCSAGHDRTGMVAAYIRMKYEHWTVDEAIAEMRRYGHNWPKFSNNGGVSSWQEDHLRAIAKMMKEDSASAASAK
jgi:protein tyrosine/serine phosphatase